MKIWDARSLLHDALPHHRCTPNVKRTIKVRKSRWSSPKDQQLLTNPNQWILLLLIDRYSFETQLISLDCRSQPSQGQELTRALNPTDSNSSYYRQDNREWAYCFNHLAMHLSILYSLPDSMYLTLMAWELKLFYNEGFPTAYSPHYAHKHTYTQIATRFLLILCPVKWSLRNRKGGSQECVLFTRKTMQLYFIHVNTQETYELPQLTPSKILSHLTATTDSATCTNSTQIQKHNRLRTQLQDGVQFECGFCNSGFKLQMHAFIRMPQTWLLASHRSGASVIAVLSF